MVSLKDCTGRFHWIYHRMGGCCLLHASKFQLSITPTHPRRPLTPSRRRSWRSRFYLATWDAGDAATDAG